MNSKTPLLTTVIALALCGSPAHAALASGGRCDQGKYSAWDKAWLTTPAKGSHFEISAGRMAQERGSPAVKELGTQLVLDHGKSLDQAAKLAKRLDIPVPRDPQPSQEWILDVLSTPGLDFDEEFASLAVRDHKQDIEEARNEARAGCNSQIRKLAENTLPELQRHLEHAKTLLQSTGGAQ